MALAAEDELEILRLLGAYTQSVSRQDLAAILDLFTEDAVWERKQGASAGKYTERVRIEGREALREFSLRMFQLQGDLRYQYIAANPVVSGSGDRATGLSTAFIFAIDITGSVSVVLIGNFEDEYRKTPAGWKFAYRGMSVSN